ncbi:putative T7SS-secreted protein [Amycolatopsis saalfeldensis]|uniref:Putative T7SS secretion signal domain-containing protein n=1 Tax=Amycolatopsis saalfeldensis TaxID=394193 RepID=A0A1H8YHM7_9PSEU|nr:hypothetical protein [Amycolatopsis saalfeldensis]SEP51626.1 hypothetical protein SAMN04489732_116168 [Amycolatopsis saalfeldensis]
MAAELGQTTDPKALIPGEAHLISGDLRDLVGNLEKMSGISEGLGGIDPKQWTGEASARFREVFGQEPKSWQSAVGVLGKGATALADYGDVLTHSQSEAQRAIEVYTQAQAASRTAAAQHSLLVRKATASGDVPAPFTDPGQAGSKEAQQILDAARSSLGRAGDAVAKELGFKKNADGTYTKKFGGKDFGAEHRTKVKKWDPKKKQWVEEDPGGWQSGKGGKSYRGEWGSQSDGLLTDKLGPLLEKLGIDTSEKTVSASAGVDVAHGSLGGAFGSDTAGGSGKIEGSVLGASAEAHAGASVLGVSAGASAEAYLAKGSAEGELHLGDHVGAKGDAQAIVGAEAQAEGKLTWAGAQASGSAFAGARAEANASAEVAGVTAGAHGEAWAGVGAEASGQVGYGDDGKFHVGASVGLGLGIGGKIGFDVSVDPGEVVDTAKDVAGDVGHVASDAVGGAKKAAGAIGHALGFG